MIFDLSELRFVDLFLIATAEKTRLAFAVLTSDNPERQRQKRRERQNAPNGGAENPFCSDLSSVFHKPTSCFCSYKI